MTNKRYWHYLFIGCATVALSSGAAFAADDEVMLAMVDASGSSGLDDIVVERFGLQCKPAQGGC